MELNVFATTEHLQTLIEELNELVEERNEKQVFFDDANAAGDAFEAEQILDTIAELSSQIDDVKANIERELRSI